MLGECPTCLRQNNTWNAEAQVGIETQLQKVFRSTAGAKKRMGSLSEALPFGTSYQVQRVNKDVMFSLHPSQLFRLGTSRTCRRGSGWSRYVQMVCEWSGVGFGLCHLSNSVLESHQVVEKQQEWVLQHVTWTNTETLSIV